MRATHPRANGSPPICMAGERSALLIVLYPDLKCVSPKASGRGRARVERHTNACLRFRYTYGKAALDAGTRREASFVHELPTYIQSLREWPIADVVTATMGALNIPTENYERAQARLDLWLSYILLYTTFPPLPHLPK